MLTLRASVRSCTCCPRCTLRGTVESALAFVNPSRHCFPLHILPQPSISPTTWKHPKHGLIHRPTDLKPLKHHFETDNFRGSLTGTCFHFTTSSTSRYASQPLRQSKQGLIHRPTDLKPLKHHFSTNNFREYRTGTCHLSTSSRNRRYPFRSLRHSKHGLIPRPIDSSSWANSS